MICWGEHGAHDEGRHACHDAQNRAPSDRARIEAYLAQVWGEAFALTPAEVRAATFAAMLRVALDACYVSNGEEREVLARMVACLPEERVGPGEVDPGGTGA